MARHEVPYVLITETKELEDLVVQWQSAPVLAVDTETAHWNQMRSGKSSISLLQIWDGQSEIIWVIDCFATDISLFIQKTMRSWETTKLIHNAPYDLAYLGGAAQAGAVVCTLQMARRIPTHLRNGLARNSLKALSEHFLDVELDKSYQASNWALRPLSKYQLAYAALDPWATYRVWEEMRALSEPEDEIVL